MHRVSRRYIELNGADVYYNGGIYYDKALLRKRRNKDLPESLGSSGYTVFYGKVMSQDGLIDSRYIFSEMDHTKNRNVLGRHINRTSNTVSNRVIGVIAYNGSERHHHETLKSRKSKPSKIGNDGRYFIPKTVIMPDGITRPVRSNAERTDREWLQTRW